MKIFFDSISRLDKKTMYLINNGLTISFFVCFVAAATLLLYNLFYISSFLYIIGVMIFELGLVIGISCIVCGIAMDYIKKQMS